MILTADTLSMIRNIAAIVRRQGQYDFSANSDLMTVSLCGLTVQFDKEYPVRLMARDLDIIVGNSYNAAANDQGQFIKGCKNALASWHGQINPLRHVFLDNEETIPVDRMRAA